MSVKLPVLDQKITYGEHLPYVKGLTPRAYPSTFDKTGSSGRHDNSKTFPLSQRDIKLHENESPRRGEYLPSLEGISSPTMKGDFTEACKTILSNHQTPVIDLSTSKISFPVTSPRIIPPKDHRRSLLLEQNRSLFDMTPSSKVSSKVLNVDGYPRRSSNLPPINFLNNFPNLAQKPVMNQSSSTQQESPIKTMSPGSKVLNVDEMADLENSSQIFRKMTREHEEQPKQEEYSSVFPKKIPNVNEEDSSDEDSSSYSEEHTDILPMCGSSIAIVSKGGGPRRVKSHLDFGKSHSAKLLFPKFNSSLVSVQSSPNASMTNIRVKKRESALKPAPEIAEALKQHLQIPQQKQPIGLPDRKKRFSLNVFFGCKKPSSILDSGSREDKSEEKSDSEDSDSGSKSKSPTSRSPMSRSPMNNEINQAKLRLERASIFSEGFPPEIAAVTIPKPRPRKSILVMKDTEEENKFKGLKLLRKKGLAKAKPVKKVKIMAVTKEQKRLKQFCWALIYPQILLGEKTKTTVNQKKIVAEDIENRLKQCTHQAIEFIKTQCAESLNNLYTENKSMIVISKEEKAFIGKKTLKAEDIEKRAIIMAGKLKPILEKMTTVIRSGGLPPFIADFLFSITREHAPVLQNYLYPFELSRLEFDHYGCLKNSTSFRVRMIIGMFFFVRVFLYHFLIHPWSIMPKISNKDRLVKNLKSCCSVLYHIIMDIFTNKLEVVPKNQVFVNLNSRLKPAKIQLSGFEPAKEDIGEIQDDIIAGLYSKKRLRPFFFAQVKQVGELKYAIGKLVDSMYAVVKASEKDVPEAN